MAACSVLWCRLSRCCLQTLRVPKPPPLLAGAALRLAALVPQRNSSYGGSGYVEDLQGVTGYEVVQSPPEWKYVERLLPMKLVPTPTPKDEYPSGWTPPDPEAAKGEYYVTRNKNHMLPVYMQIKHRGMNRTTLIGNVKGDIWKLHEDLGNFLEEKLGKRLDIRVHEMTSELLVRGEHVINVQRFLLSKGF